MPLWPLEHLSSYRKKSARCSWEASLEKWGLSGPGTICSIISTRPCRGCLVPGGENLETLLVIPVMNDALYHIGVCRRDRAEHVSGDVSAPVAHAHLVSPQQLLLGENAGQIQDRPLPVGVFDQEAWRGLCLRVEWIRSRSTLAPQLPPDESSLIKLSTPKTLLPVSGGSGYHCAFTPMPMRLIPLQGNRRSIRLRIGIIVSISFSCTRENFFRRSI